MRPKEGWNHQPRCMCPHPELNPWPFQVWERCFNRATLDRAKKILIKTIKSSKTETKTLHLHLAPIYTHTLLATFSPLHFLFVLWGAQTVQNLLTWTYSSWYILSKLYLNSSYRVYIYVISFFSFYYFFHCLKGKCLESISLPNFEIQKLLTVSSSFTNLFLF